MQGTTDGCKLMRQSGKMSFQIIGFLKDI